MLPCGKRFMFHILFLFPLSTCEVACTGHLGACWLEPPCCAVAGLSLAGLSQAKTAPGPGQAQWAVLSLPD